MKKTDLAYIAGLIDGEGCISIYGRKSRGKDKTLITNYEVSVSIDMIPKEPLLLIQALFGGALYFRSKKPINKRPTWRWCVRNKNALIMIEVLKPYLIVKSPQAIIAMRVLKIRPSNRHLTEMEKFIFEMDRKAMNELNKRGTGAII